MKWKPARAAAIAQLEAFLPRSGGEYSETRNYDDGRARTNVSQLSPWLHAGVISEREVVERVLSQHSVTCSEKFIAEVFWRIYFKGYLEQRPSIWGSYCEQRDAAMSRLTSNAESQTAYAEATEGRTGIPAFDLWAQELVETGYLHNHSRMWFASIWIFTLKLDWELGADFFLRYLIDGDAASNTLSWRWVAGLHTKGKTYLARADNIARYTANHPHGPMEARDLADKAHPLEDPVDHCKRPLTLPPNPSKDWFEQSYALLLHDEAASHVPIDLPTPPSLVIAAARPDARSPQPVGDLAQRFAREAVRNGAIAASDAFGCPVTSWEREADLGAILSDAGIKALAVPYLPTGWTSDALLPEIEAIATSGDSVTLLPDLDRATWPSAKAGFFGVKKHIDGILGELGISGAG
ncbi:MAG: FAD-binding domain-containing protein [Pseudomonadota bacterium]